MSCQMPVYVMILGESQYLCVNVIHLALDTMNGWLSRMEQAYRDILPQMNCKKGDMVWCVPKVFIQDLKLSSTCMYSESSDFWNIKRPEDRTFFCDSMVSAATQPMPSVIRTFDLCEHRMKQELIPRHYWCIPWCCGLFVLFYSVVS